MRRLRLIKGWKDLPDGDRGAAVAMGNFDGVHRGHQQVIALAAKGHATFDTACLVNGKTVVDGEALIMVPKRGA